MSYTLTCTECFASALATYRLIEGENVNMFGINLHSQEMRNKLLPVEICEDGDRYYCPAISMDLKCSDLGL